EKPCGGGITGRALDIVRASMDPAAFSAVRIERASFEHESQHVDMVVDPANGSPDLVVASRRDFDGALLAAAAAAGTSLIRERVVRVESDEAVWSVSTRNQTIRTRWLVGADGPNSLVRRRV